MTMESPETTLARILGLSDDEAPLPPRYAEARARLIEGLSGSDAPSAMSIARVAAYARGKLDNEERQAFERDMASSEEISDEVMSALAFLEKVDACQETVPAERLEAASARLRDADSGKSDSPPALTVPDLVAYLKDGVPLTMDQQRMLFSDPVLRSEFHRLRHEFAARSPSGSVLEMRALAAAASSLEATSGLKPWSRGFDGGCVTIKDLEAKVLVEVLIRFEEGKGSAPGWLMLVGAGNEVLREPLGPPDKDGDIMFYRDPNNPEHATFLRLLRDPHTVATFLPQARP